MKKYIKIAAFLSTAVLASCSDSFRTFPESDGTIVFPETINTKASEDGIVVLPETVPGPYKEMFKYYTSVTAPNGKPIHILIQDKWSREKIIKGRNVLKHILTNAPGTKYGANKVAVANSLANQQAAMIFLNDSSGLEDPNLEEIMLHGTVTKLQDLRENEITVEGSPDYLQHKTRDAAFEEILHFVHDYGIKKVLPDFQKEIEAATDAASAKGFQGWPEDEPENHNNEYFAAVYDVYLDLWKQLPTVYEGEDIVGEVPEGTTHFGAYPFATNRQDLKKNDPAGYAIIKDFFPPYLTYKATLPASFKGQFLMVEQEGVAYSHKSQHLLKVALSGRENAGIIGNKYNNTFWGNAGNNQINGNKGLDTVVFRGKASQYTIEKNANKVVVRDHKSGRDGVDTLTNIEKLKFADKTISL
ncbi:hypothetical protein [Polycladidibacter stylochi]|uniref:hypothetical protein n=1 Tax=Polycladidibacter stylochi TaxID=1807766 RepID=UPI0008354EAB|nr:hypothetical protein [Pseudovibrio stylochi]